MNIIYILLFFILNIDAKKNIDYELFDVCLNTSINESTSHAPIYIAPASVSTQLPIIPNQNKTITGILSNILLYSLFGVGILGISLIGISTIGMKLFINTKH